MQQSQAYYKELLSGFIQERITPEEVKELYAWIQQELDLYAALMNEPDMLVLLEETAEASSAHMQAATDLRIREQLLTLESSQRGNKGIYRVIRNWWWGAAVLVIGIAVGVTITLGRKQSTVIVEQRPTTDVTAPTANRATIKMADGRTLSLDSLAKGVLAQQGDIKLVKLEDGQIAYQDATSGKLQEHVSYNTLNNPYGSRVVDVTLSDGSRVWLNAGSSLTYPVAFVGQDRKVTVNGEAYFEVKHDASKPFYVTKAALDIKVLGTRFNVNAYDDEQDMKITLLEGAVQLTQHAQSLLLKPGQQVIAGDNHLKINDKANLDVVMAWKNGWFNFDQVPLQEVMRQLARWYDVEVEYQGDMATRKFSGEIQRELNLSEVLEGLQDIGLHFTISAKKLRIMP